jgi:hypothetical protein
MGADKLFKTMTGRVLISIILGVGMGALFRRVCSQCIEIKGPSLKDMEKYIYKLDGACYKYTPYVVNCKNPI